MRTLVLVAGAALMVAGLTAGCQRTTPGTVAMTTEPGPPIASPTQAPQSTLPGLPGIPLPNIPLPNIPLPGLPGNTDVPEVPAPPDALTMKCDDFNKLDEATRLAVIRAILAQENNPLGPNGESVGQMLVEAACQFLPSATVSEVLMGTPPR
ncbi:hypothetical protein ACGFK1_28765 [Mycobacterium sp. NPDC048908]|uniref:hypothetical protein n=1 Tax=Mycobacterium sp. NPDC048908 TaxID=3364292 RepID=UPI003719E14A